MEIYEKALKLAVKAHKEQLRKHDGSPYVVHTIMVARILGQHGFGEMVQAAGLVHDVLEDTDISEAELRSQLGDVVVDIVTAVSEDTELVWEERKQKYIESVVAGGEAVWAVSVADKVHNARSLIAYHNEVGAKAWEVFNRGKEQKVWFEKTLLQSLQKVWQHPLLDVYARLVTELEELEG
jgi:(p)ppGpp synthase/HD superfamily hydrolase